MCDDGREGSQGRWWGCWFDGSSGTEAGDPALGGSREFQCVLEIKVPVKHWPGQTQLDMSSQWRRGEDVRARPCAQKGAVSFILHKNTI